MWPNVYLLNSSNGHAKIEAPKSRAFEDVNSVPAFHLKITKVTLTLQDAVSIKH